MAVNAMRPERRSSRDAGMTLIEVIVAVALFGVLASALLVVLTSTIQVSNDDGRRTVAGNLAARELEITREIFTSQNRGPDKVVAGTNKNPLPGGTVGQPLVVDDVPYTVTTRIDQQQLDKDYASTCDQDSGAFAFISVHVEVKWPGLGGVMIVSMVNGSRPPKGTYQPGAGHIGIKVIDALGEPRGGVAVTATPKSGTAGETKTVTTSEDGCALIENRAPGSWEVKASAPGYVSQQGVATPTLTANVVTGTLWKGTFFYDRATALDVTICPPGGGYPLPQSLNSTPVSLGHPSLLPNGAKAFPGTGSRTSKDCAIPTVNPDGSVTTPPADMRVAETRSLTNLWPYPAGYQAWAGGCPSNDPQYNYAENGQTRDHPVTVEPGETSSTSVPLHPLNVSVLLNVAAVEAVPMTVTNTGTVAVCPDAPTIRLGTPTGGVLGVLAAKLKTSLPYGLWRIQRVGGLGSTAQVNLKKGDPVLEASL